MGVVIDHREDLRLIIKGLQSQGKRVVFTNGVFDLLHVGHIRSLIDARSRGEFLVVAANSDTSVKKLKGPDLPIIPWKERAEVLAALECVDYVTILEEQSADDLLAYLKPNIHAKGTDYTPENVPERETVLGYGGDIAIVGDPKKHSTTDILGRVGALFTGKKNAVAGKKMKQEKPVKTASKKAVATKKNKNTPVKKTELKKSKTRAKAASGKPSTKANKKIAKKPAAPLVKKKTSKKLGAKKPDAKKSEAKKKVRKPGKSRELNAY
ncbi:MAG: adenylyltransferase/cytidyltransferase family protein [Planctomycetota bacterium]